MQSAPISKADLWRATNTPRYIRFSLPKTALPVPAVPCSEMKTITMLETSFSYSKYFMIIKQQQAFCFLLATTTLDTYCGPLVVSGLTWKERMFGNDLSCPLWHWSSRGPLLEDNGQLLFLSKWASVQKACFCRRSHDCHNFKRGHALIRLVLFCTGTELRMEQS